ncbi:MAG: hypothetical protein WCA39_16025 [Nitrososphaeraceae archaeon]
MQIVDISSLVMFHIGWAYTDDYLTQHFESILVNDAAKMYGNLAKNLIDEILSNYDIGSSSQSSLHLILQSDQELANLKT